MKLWEVITTVRDLGGTMEDVRELLKLERGETSTEQPPVEDTPPVVDNPVDNVDNCAEELEALRLENAQLKGQLQTYNILHASTCDIPQSTPVDDAVEIGVNMIK